MMISVPSGLSWLLIFAGTLIGMELVARITHKYVMHGWLWSLHRSHHEPRTGRFEKNDWFAVFFSMPAIVLIHFGTAGRPALLAAGLGMTAYGVLYALLHDSLVHRRLIRLAPPRWRYLVRLVEAHRLHHATIGKHGAVSFGFLYAPPVEHLVRELRQQRLARRQP